MRGSAESFAGQRRWRRRPAAHHSLGMRSPALPTRWLCGAFRWTAGAAGAGVRARSYVRPVQAAFIAALHRRGVPLGCSEPGVSTPTERHGVRSRTLTVALVCGQRVDLGRAARSGIPPFQGGAQRRTVWAETDGAGGLPLALREGTPQAALGHYAPLPRPYARSRRKLVCPSASRTACPDRFPERRSTAHAGSACQSGDSELSWLSGVWRCTGGPLGSRARRWSAPSERPGCALPGS
jgi:hypothetical protein